MNRNYLILFATSITIIIHNIFYTKYVIYEDNITYSYYLKWIPTLLLIVQSIYFNFFVLENVFHKTLYGICLIIAYFFCMLGDIILMLPYESAYLAGMVSFLPAYLFTGIPRAYRLNRYLEKRHISKILVGTILILLVQLTYLPYLIGLVRENDKFNNGLLIGTVIIYSCYIKFSLLCNYMYLVVHPNVQAFFSFIGIILFGISDCLLIFHDIHYPAVWLEILCLVLYWSGLNILGWSIYRKLDLL